MENREENLAVIMPVYNEEGAVETVVKKWSEELEKLKIDYKIFAYNDGSKDNTAKILEKLAGQNNKIIAVNKENSGHGATILQGYRENAKKFSWIFQTDSDDEMSPEYFNRLWEKREKYDFLIGERDNRIQQVPRKVISLVSRFCVSVFYGKGVWDVNSPYRLMRSEKFVDLFNLIPKNTFAPNLIVSGYVAKKKLRFFEAQIPCQIRQTGEVSIKKWKLLKAAMKSFWQTIIFSFETI